MAKQELKIKPRHGKTTGYVSPNELNTVYNNLLVAQRDTEKWIAEQFKDIDLNNNDPENIERINQRKILVKDLWNEHNGKTFVNRPKSVKHLQKTIRGKHTFQSRAIQLGTIIPTAFAGKGPVDTSPGLIGSDNPYDFIEKSYQFQTKIENVTRTRLGKDLNPNSLKDLGMVLHQPVNKESNVYFNTNLDRTNTTSDLNAAREARLKFKNKNPHGYAANPGGYLYELDENNQFFAARPAEAGSPYVSNRRGLTGNSNFGDQYWSGRGSGRSFHQANADTRALLIKQTNNERAVNLLSNDQLSRFRISGAFDSDKSITLIGDGRNTRIKKLSINQNY
tara:strand:+ start:416 stop:1423 length:1008 start_codon:yes stop_codon:yes gene_type:complete